MPRFNRCRSRFRVAVWAVAGAVAAASFAAQVAPDAPVTLRAAAAPDRVLLSVAPRLAATWADLHLARLAVRTPGTQRRIEVAPPTKGQRELELAVEAGCSLLLIDTGPPRTTLATDDWRRVTHATKIVHCADDLDGAGDDPTRALAQRARAGTMVTAKVGSRIEIQPLLSPTQLRVGGDLPVRVFVDGGAIVDATVLAVAPDATTRAATSDAVGAAVFRIDQAGPWRLHLDHQNEGEPRRTATLLFHVAPETLWTRAEAQR